MVRIELVVDHGIGTSEKNREMTSSSFLKMMGEKR
jgi:hypothetical protein